MTGKRLLFIDPDPASTKYLEYEFKKAGYQVFLAQSGKEGLIAAWKERPHVIVVDPVFNDIPVAEFVEKLRKDARTSSTKIMALSSLTNTTEIQEAINIGFDRYITKEGEAIAALQETIQQLMSGTSGALHTAQTDEAVHSAAAPPEPKPAPEPEGKGKTIVFLSAKGGTGTSSLCANLAHAFHRRVKEARIALVDLVLPLGSIAELVDYKEEMNIVNISQMTSADASSKFFEENLPFIEKWGFHLLAGPIDPEQSNKIEVPNIPVIINTLKSTYDYVFIDLGRSLSRISLPIITSANQVILIVGLDEATVSLTLTVMNYLKQNGLKNHQVYPLINRAVGLEGLTKRNVDEMLGIEITGNIPHIGANFVMSNNDSLPVAIRFPDNVVAVAMREISEKLEKRMEAAPGYDFYS